MRVPEFNPAELEVESWEIERHRQRSLDQTNREQAWVRTGLVGLLYAVLAIVNITTLDSEIAATAMMFALFIAVVFIGLSVFHRTNDYPAGFTNLILFIEMGVLQADAIAFNILTGAVMSGFGTYIMIVAAGMFMTKVHWFGATIAMLLISWGTTLGYQAGEINLTREVLMLVSAILGGSMFIILRIRGAERLSESRLREDKYREQLRDALHHIHTLSGLLPICASCKNIRDENNEWQPVEAYVSGRTDAEFTHSVCPSCREELYPDLKKN